MSDDRTNPWAGRDGSDAAAPEADIEMTRQQAPYDLSGYEAAASQPAPAAAWGPYGQPAEAPAPVPPVAPVPSVPAQPYGAYGTQQFPVQQQPQPQPYPSSVASAPYRPPQVPATPKEGGLGQLFDFSFTGYATPGLVKIVYTLAVVAAGLGWLVWTISSLMVNPLLGIVVLLFGAIPALLSIAYSRFLLEFVLATIRTAAKTEEIAAKLAALDAPGDGKPQS